MEQKDILPRVLHTNTYKDVYVSLDKTGKTLIISVMAGYNELTGMDIRYQATISCPGIPVYWGNPFKETGVERVVITGKRKERTPSARPLIDTLTDKIGPNPKILYSDHPCPYPIRPSPV